MYSTALPLERGDIDTRPSLDFILLALLFFITALNFGMDRVLGVTLMAGSTLAVFFSVGLTWLIERRNRDIARWFLVLAITVIIASVSILARMPIILALLVLPTALAATLLDLRSAAILTLLQTLLLAELSRSSTDQAMAISVILVVVWAVLGVMAAVYWASYDLAHWSWEHYAMAVRLLDEQRDRKAALQQALDDLAHANQQLALINERLAIARLVAEEAEKTKAAFVANVSHEFRTPLNIIIGLTDLLVETPQVYGQPLPRALLDDLSIVKRNCEHLANLVNDVLDLSQVDAGHLALQREHVDVADIIRRSLIVVRPLIEKRGLQLRQDVADLPSVYCDPVRIRQVVVNLLSNAARYTVAGSITVRACQRGHKIEVSVTDTGPGIAPDDAKRIFEPFYRGNSGRFSAEKGSGLGLSVSRQFVELHGGHMTLQSAPGEGSTFSFTLPIAPLATSTVAARSWLREDWSWHERAGHAGVAVAAPKSRLVLCDATGEVASVFARYAQDSEIIAAPDLAQATALVQGSPSHALVINAPSPAALQQLVQQAQISLPDTPVIGCSIPERDQQARLAGALGYLLKPIARPALDEALRSLRLPLRDVMVVDDEPDALSVLQRMIPGCVPDVQVRTATSGAEALAKMRASKPDLLLLDIVLPDMSGWDVLAAKCQDGAICTIPVLMLSAQDPRDRPMQTPMIVAALGEGLSVSKLLHCVRDLSRILPRPD